MNAQAVAVGRLVETAVEEGCNSLVVLRPYETARVVCSDTNIKVVYRVSDDGTVSEDQTEV